MYNILERNSRENIYDVNVTTAIFIFFILTWYWAASLTARYYFEILVFDDGILHLYVCGRQWIYNMPVHHVNGIWVRHVLEQYYGMYQ